MRDNRPFRILSNKDFFVTQKDSKYYSPFHGCVMSDCNIGSWFLNKIVRNKFFFNRDKCRIAISPVTGGSELLYIQNWYTRWFDNKRPILIYEPVAFLKGVNRKTGIVISLRYSMVELTYVENGTITRYWWKYHHQFRYKNNQKLDSGKQLENQIDIAQIYNQIQLRLEREKASIVNVLISQIKQIICNSEYRGISIFFAAYKNYTLFTSEQCETFNINCLNYENFCETILRGLQ